jgi:exodeoxyribonuclease VII large subunit
MPKLSILSVSDLNFAARELLESGFGLVPVAGEISNLARPSSGHLYFTLKDTQAQVRCAFFRNKMQRLPFRPENGLQVVVHATVSLYEPRGDYQLIVEFMEEAGQGALQRQFEQLKAKLDGEGLFDSARKQSPPALPQRIGVITSPTGAAIRDILSVLQRRFAALPVLIYPVPVQGKDAPPALINALRQANQRQECDVLIMTRGGGSLEDLWAFNDEQVARAIFASRIPVISAVGHEIDFTIADFVADMRAPTPSAAAELSSPDGDAWRQRASALAQRLRHAMHQVLRHKQHGLTALQARLLHPGQRLRLTAQRVDELELRLHQAMRHNLQRTQERQRTLQARLRQANPQRQLEHLQQQQVFLTQRVQHAMQYRQEQAQNRFALLSSRLHGVSPLATLERGYAIVTHGNAILRKAEAVVAGDKITAQLQEGRLSCVVEKVENN